MKKSDLHFDLPPELIAQAPLAERSASRLLVLDGAQGRIADGGFRDLLRLLDRGDLLVFNDTRVIPARLFGRKSTGGEVEVLIERVLGAHEVRAQMRASKTPKEGTRQELGDGVPATVLGRDGEFFRIRFETPEPLESVLHRIGRMLLPPYIRDVDHQRDTTRYQTVFAREPGAVAAPTAGLHFDAPLLDDLRERGVQFGHVTLHVGAGTFQPMRVDSVHRTHHAFGVAERRCRVVRTDACDAGRRAPRGRGRHHRRACARIGDARQRGQALCRRDPHLHVPGLSHPFGRCDDHQFPSARIDTADAGVGLRRARARAVGLSPSRMDWLRYLVTVGGFEDEDGWRWKIDPGLRMGGFGPWRPEWSLIRLPGLRMPFLGILAMQPEVMAWSTRPEDLEPYLPEEAVIESWEDSGHFLHIEFPERAADRVLAFLAVGS